MGNLLKILVSIILFLLLAAGILYLLFYLDILKPPAFLFDIPVIGKIITTDEKNSPPPKPDKETLVQQENNNLKETVEKKNEELKELQLENQELEQQLQTLAASEDKLKDEIVNLNEQLIDLKTLKDSQTAAYKDMAKYYAEMNAKDAADIISRLEMEHIIGILNHMSADLVADILQNMSKDKAAEVTRKMLVVSP